MDRIEHKIPEGYEARIEGYKVIMVPKESEDERIRKMLVEQMERWKKCAEDNNVEQDVKDASDALAYLEKQKENPKTVNSIPSFCVSDVKWADTIITRAIVALSNDVDYNRDEPCKYRREIDDLKKLLGVLCGQKEQKPGEDNEYRKAYLDGWNARNLQAAREQKPAEWSEEEIVKWLKEHFYISSFDNTKIVSGFSSIEEAIDSLRNRLKSLPKRFSLGEKKEWSEGREKQLNEIADYLKYKGREDDAVFLRNLCPQPHWKPSEEQMEALCFVLDYHVFGSTKRKELIKSLYDDLKKMM